MKYIALFTMLVAACLGAASYTHNAGVVTVTGGDWSTPATLAGAYDADVAGSWGVITEVVENAVYVLNCDLNIGNDSDATYFRTIKENVYMNDDKKLLITANAVFQMGLEYNESGRNGSFWNLSPLPSSSIHYLMNNDATAELKMFASTIFWRNAARLTLKDGIVKIKDGAFVGRYYEDSANLGNQRLVFNTAKLYIDGMLCSNLYSVDFQSNPPYAKNIECNRVLYGLRGNDAINTITLYDSIVPNNNTYQFGCLNSTANDKIVNIVNPQLQIANYLAIANVASSTGASTLNEQYTFDMRLYDTQGEPKTNVPVVCKDVSGNTVFSTTTGIYERVIDDTSYMAAGGQRRPWFACRIPTTQRNSYYASGLYWVWFVQHTAATTTNLGYKTSADGKTWSSFTLVRAGSGSAELGDAVWTLYYDSTNNRVYYCYGDLFRCGTPNADGTVTWAGAEAANSGFSDACFVVDTAGYMWLGREGNIGRSQTASTTSYGTAVWYPGPTSSDKFAAIGAHDSRSILCPLTGDDMYVIRYGWGENVILTGNYSEDRAAFGADETIGSVACYGSPTLAYIVHAAINNYGTSPKVVYLDVNGNMRALTRSAGAGGTWSGETVIATSPYTDFNKSTPQIAVDRSNGSLYVFWEDLNCIWKQTYTVAGGWGTAPIKVIEDKLDNHGPHLMATRDVDANGNVGLTYLSEDYKLKYLIVDADASSYSFSEKGAIPTQTITRRSWVGGSETQTDYYPFSIYINGIKTSEIDFNKPFVWQDLPVYVPSPANQRSRYDYFNR